MRILLAESVGSSVQVISTSVYEATKFIDLKYNWRSMTMKKISCGGRWPLDLLHDEVNDTS